MCNGVVAVFVTESGAGVANLPRFALNELMLVASRKVRRLHWSLLMAAIVLRAVIPLGYMPGNLLAGEFMVLCPTGLPAHTSLASAHAHHGDDAAMLDADQACPIGAALKQAALPPDITFAAQLARYVPQPERVLRTSFRSRTAQAYRSRAPPQHLS